MITAGAIVVASFFIVSTVTQLHGALRDNNSTGPAIFDASFWFKACACILVGGNGLVWVLDASDTIECPSKIDNVVSTVAILSALAFVAALKLFLLSTAMINVSASLILVVAHAPKADNICGSINIMLGSAVLLFTIVRAASLLFPKPQQPTGRGKIK